MNKNWYSLDNTAKIMPSTTTNLNTNVFRLVCTLIEDVDGKVLQEALDKALIISSRVPPKALVTTAVDATFTK